MDTADVILGLAALAALALAVPYDGARDGGQHASRMRPNMRLPWPLIDAHHLDKYLSVVPLWVVVMAVVAKGLGWLALPALLGVALFCSWGWDYLAHKRLRSVGSAAVWPTKWRMLKKGVLWLTSILRLR